MQIVEYQKIFNNQRKSLQAPIWQGFSDSEYLASRLRGASKSYEESSWLAGIGVRKPLPKRFWTAVHKCSSTCVYVRVYTYTYRCTDVHVHYIHTYTYIYIHIHVHTYTYIRMCIHVYMYICVSM